jgi:hypothetical protein
MSSVWVPVVAALGASLLTGAASLGVAWKQARWHAAADRGQRLASACSDVLSGSMLVANRARVLNATIRVRSGLTEATDIALHHRNPVDPLEVYDWLAQDHTALHKAVSEVWLRSPAILGTIASDIELQCARLLELATSLPDHRTFLQNLKGVKRDEAFVTAWLSEVEHLGQLRKSFLKAAQQELGEASASLLRQQPSDSSP